MVEVAVVGGGLAGLAAALRLQRHGVDVHLYEAADRVGGVVQTCALEQGFIFERGPHSIRAGSAHIGQLIADLELDGAITPSLPAARRRFIWRHGRLQALPDAPHKLIGSTILSFGAKLRLFREPFVAAAAVDVDETVAAFFRRRLGAEVVDALVDPFVTGIFAGDPEQLGIDAFPTVRAAERDHGSLFKALRARRSSAAGSGLYSFDGGLERLPRSLGAALGERIHLGYPISSVQSGDEHVALRSAKGDVEAEHVVIATPAVVAADLLASVDAARWLAGLPRPHVARVGLGYRDGDLGDIDGFGLLCASDSPLPGGVGSVLGVIFSSSVFAGRVPDGHRSVAVMIGGVRDPDAASLSDEAIEQRAIAAVDALVGSSDAPVAVQVSRWPAAIPQYLPGHGRRVEALRAALPARVELAGNYLQGVSMDAAVATGLQAAEAIARGRR